MAAVRTRPTLGRKLAGSCTGDDPYGTASWMRGNKMAPTSIKPEARRKTGSSRGVGLDRPSKRSSSGSSWTGRVGGVTAEIQSGESQQKRPQRHQRVGAQPSTGEVPWSCAPSPVHSASDGLCSSRRLVTATPQSALFRFSCK